MCIYSHSFESCLLKLKKSVRITDFKKNKKQQTTNHQKGHELDKIENGNGILECKQFDKIVTRSTQL